jgi:hypothetical protein
MLISKMQTYPIDKMPPKKLKLKNEKKWDSKFKKQFFNFNFFWGHFVTKTSLLF